MNSRSSQPVEVDSGTSQHTDRIESLDLRTKVRLLTGATTFTTAAEESIGLGEVRLSDGPTGVRGLDSSGVRQVTLLPNATVLASSWDTTLLYDTGQLLAEEALAQQIHVVLGPTINLHRSPLGGRLFEAYSEDPLLTGNLATAYVRGLQDAGVGACLKHLVANESETERNTMNSIVDEATLRELYLTPFEIAVADADPWSIMDAYNNINGVAATEQVHVNTEIVKEEWNYSGLIMSDWLATQTAAPAANGGLDLVMPGPDGPWGEALVAAVEAGEVPMSVIDDHVHRLLVLAARVGALGEQRQYPTDLPTPTSLVRKEQLIRLAAAGMTVLTNRDGALPLQQTQSVALIGRHAVDTVCMGGGSAEVNPPHQVSIAEGMTALPGTSVSVVDGVAIRARPASVRRGVLLDPDTREPGIHFVLRSADGSVIEERRSASAVTTIGWDDDLDADVAAIEFRAVSTLDGSVDIGGMGAGDWTVHVGVDTFAYTLGQPLSDDETERPGPSLQEVLGGALQQPPFRTDTSVVSSGTEIRGVVRRPMSPGRFAVTVAPAQRGSDEAIAEAVSAAAEADVAVVVVGTTDERETEAFDKSTLHLPGDQDAMVSAVASAARRTVVVVNAATPVIMPWRDEVDAILWAGLPGQEAGHAVAAALYGSIEPSGRLVSTFPAEDGQSPAWSVTPVDGDLNYTEGVYIGYRGHHARHAPEPNFWFGHGLGYSSWEYREAHVTDDSSVQVSIANVGDRESREVVQLYFDPVEPDQPVRLVGWQGVTVQAGSAADVEVSADPRMLRRWDTSSSRWAPLSGRGQFILARGLGDVRARLDAVPAEARAQRTS
ncbi:beta-glucosidase family protein [Rhodococcus marinonascens]|uniref:beta-glucosidase family protein n=1 Tax=Rhodococcus marinonascens TaxID=38311 RepID=UPI000AD7036D|nr:glycoside hydrolase family 3 protein [Rhodococcus marinonascens]